MLELPFKAVIFDLDGVITKTALVHSAAWKKMFDEFLRVWSARTGKPFKEFSHENDYLPFVDGKPRYKGVDDFLKSRGIELPFGTPEDSVEVESVCGLGNRKNIAFNEVLDKDGVSVYESTIHLIAELKENGVRIGVASSSKNCRVVLERAGLLHLFETRIDGEVSAELGLKGKPEPDIFTVAADRLETDYEKAIVVEDAVSGVQAGRKGGFGLVLGIARENNKQELINNGADIVVNDLEEIDIEDLKFWFYNALEDDKWSLSYHDYDPKKERSRESLLAIGNGYFGTRGAFEECEANKVNYPGTYIAGLYNRLTSKVAEKDIENEDFVNAGNWLPFTFRIDNEPWFNPNFTSILEITRKLNFRNGVLERDMIVRDHTGRETLIESRRTASMENPHLAAIEYIVTPINYSGRISIKTGLDGTIINEGVERYKDLNQQHLSPIMAGGQNGLMHLFTQTTQSEVLVGMAAKILVYRDETLIKPDFNITKLNGAVYGIFSVDCEAGTEIKVDKGVSICTSNDYGIQDALSSAVGFVSKYHSFDDLLLSSEKQWDDLWSRIDIVIEGDRFSQKLLRLHLFHLMVSVSPHNKNIDASITARGLHGEAYRGHIFWDELFILPLYCMTNPEVAKSMLMYRYRRLQKAKENAAQHGYKGAMFPWQSGSDGREETQVIHINPLTGKWGDDYSSLQRHVSLAIAYNVWFYYHYTHDSEFIDNYGAELLFEISRFWESKCELEQKTGRLHIRNVMGPDEFHEAYHGADEGGLTDNAYTNLMVHWLFKTSSALYHSLTEEAKIRLVKKTNLSDMEVRKWHSYSSNLNIVIQEDVIAQFDGYFELKEIDWDYFRTKYGNIYRMDRILKAEGLSADEFKVAKQADALMIFYNFSQAVVKQMLENLGYPASPDFLKKNFDYYFARTSHGSTLSRVVHSYLAHQLGNAELAWNMYSEALASDFTDIQGGTTGEGIHTGVMAGTVLHALHCYAGLNLNEEDIILSPALPKNWKSIQFRFTFRKNNFDVMITHTQVFLKYDGNVPTVQVKIHDKTHQIANGRQFEIMY